MATKKGVDDNHNISAEIAYQDKMMSLGNFLLDLSKRAKQQKNIDRCNKAVKELTEIALYINTIEHENMNMRLQIGFKNDNTYSQITKLLKQCLKQ